MLRYVLFASFTLLVALAGAALTYFAICRTEEEPIIAFARWPCILVFQWGAVAGAVALSWYYPRLPLATFDDKELAQFAEALAKEVDRRTQ